MRRLSFFDNDAFTIFSTNSVVVYLSRCPTMLGVGVLGCWDSTLIIRWLCFSIMAICLAMRSPSYNGTYSGVTLSFSPSPSASLTFSLSSNFLISESDRDCMNEMSSMLSRRRCLDAFVDANSSCNVWTFSCDEGKSDASRLLAFLVSDI